VVGSYGSLNLAEYNCLSLSYQEAYGATLTSDGGVKTFIYYCFTNNCNSAAFFHPNKILMTASALVATYLFHIQI